MLATLRASLAIRIPIIVAALVPLVATRASFGARPAPRSETVPPVVFTQVPRDAAAETLAAPACGAVLPGSRIVRVDRDGDDGRLTNLTPDFWSAGRPDVSFDGQRLLFVGKRSPTDALDVWEVHVDGTGLRQVTRDVGECSSAVYLSTIYTIDAEEPVHQIAFCSDAASDATPSLYTCRMDGTRVRRITFDPYGATNPYPLSDGRLLYCRKPSPEADHDGRGSTLFTVNTDGTDLFVFAAAHEPFAARGTPCETPDGHVVYVESTREGGGGALVAVSRAASLRTRRLVARDPAGLYFAPAALPSGDLLVSYRPRASRSWGLYVLDPTSGSRTATVYDDPQWHELDAAVIRVRAEPPGRSSVVDDRARTGLLYCLNANLSGTKHPHGVGVGRIRSLQIFRARTKRAPDGSPAEELLGTVPVESDGSFQLRIPAGTPMRLRTLDADGAVLQTMDSWMWVMPNEARGCIGCHEDRELSPPNRHVLALRKDARPVGSVDQPPAGDGSSRKRTAGDSE